MKLLLIICLLPLELLAQDITGIWTGFLHTEGNDLPYELVISGNNDKLTGYSMTVFTFNGRDNVGVKSIKFKRKSKNIAFEDDKMIFNNYSTPPRRIKLYGDLFLKNEDTTMVLTGTFSTRTLDFRSQDKTPFIGTIELKKQKDFIASRLVSKLDEMNLLGSLSFVPPKGIKKEDPTSAALASTSEALPRVKETESVIPSRPASDKKTALSTAKSGTVPSSTLTLTEPDPAPPQAAREKQIPVDAKTVVAGRKQAAIIQSKPGELPPSTLTLTAPEQAPPQVEKEKQLSVGSGITATPDIKVATTASAVPQKTVSATPPSIVRLPRATPPPAAALAERKTEIIRSVPFTSDSLVLSLYDNGQVDGDTVSVVLNGKVIIAKKGLTTNAIRAVVHITPDMGDSLQLIMYAENLGSIPPNTGLLIVQDGEQRNEIRFAGDMQKSSAVILRRKR